MKSSAYSMLAVSAVLDGLQIVGLWDGDDAIVITPGVEVGTMMIGADGSSIFSQTADRSATIVIRLQHTSATNRQLQQKLAAQRAGRLVGFTFDIKEKNSGKGGNTDQAFISAAPEDSYGTNATMQEWTIITGDWTPFIPNA